MCVGTNVDIVGYSEHKVGHDLLCLSIVGVHNSGYSRWWVQGGSRTDEDISAEVDRGMLLVRRFLILLICRLRRGFCLGRSDQVTVDDNVLLNHTFACKNDMFGTKDGRTTTDLVSCFLRIKSDYRRTM